jgi:hypothetical protein
MGATASTSFRNGEEAHAQSCDNNSDAHVSRNVCERSFMGSFGVCRYGVGRAVSAAPTKTGETN